VKISGNGTTIEYDRCGHCGKMPKKAWLLKELEFWSRLKCGICGVLFKVVSLKVVHHKEVGYENWVSTEVERESWVHLEQEMPSGCDLKERFHEACLTKAFPFGSKAESEKRAAEITAKKAGK
jgi:transcription elongation factor Elf1